MEENKDEAIVLCGSVITSTAIVPGSIKVECTDCGISVWLSPASSQLAKQFKKITPLCLSCGSKRMTAAKTTTGKILDMHITKATMDEVNTYIKQNPPGMDEKKGSVILLRTIRGDFPFQAVKAPPGVYEAYVNPHGAVSVIAENGEMLGLKPGEFEWLTKE
jgi:hypothetical protein